MRICSIRGANLASLAQEFVVDFEQPPLSTAGLFGVTGPTGAGKSTLLDAMFLALFDKTPRLCATGGPGIGLESDDEKQRLGANDVRSLVTDVIEWCWLCERICGRREHARCVYATLRR